MEKSVMDEIIWKHLGNLHRELREHGIRRSVKFSFLDDDPILPKNKNQEFLDTQS